MTNSQGPQDDYISQEQDADIGNWGEGAIRDLFADKPEGLDGRQSP